MLQAGRFLTVTSAVPINFVRYLISHLSPSANLLIVILIFAPVKIFYANGNQNGPRLIQQRPRQLEEVSLINLGAL